MNKLLWRYLIYFGVFICLVAVLESAPLQGAFAKIGLKVNFGSLGTYAPLFLSALLIDITYRIGKRQNEIAERQNQIAEQQKEVATRQNEITEQQRKDMEYKFYRDLYTVVCGADEVIKNFLTSCRFGLEWGKRTLIKRIEEIQKAEKQINAISIDVELRFPTQQYVLSSYNLCFSWMLYMLDVMGDFVGDDGYCNFEMSDEEWIKATKEDRVNIILDRIAEKELKAKLEKDFQSYLRVRERIEKCDLAQTIKEQIITNDNKRKNNDNR